MPDKRATHFWDGAGFTLKSYQQVLNIPEEAWDIYMVYGPDARWEGKTPPKPDYWMHQLGHRDKPRVKGPYLDPGVFADKVNAVLSGSKLEQPEASAESAAKKQPPVEFTKLSKGLPELKAAFNGAKDKVRAVLLLSPT